jgi:hypothetical protein
MAFLTVKQESVETEAGSNYISKSGIYDVTLKHVEVTNTQNGAVQVNYFFDKAMSYGNTIIGVSGQPTFGYKILEALAAVLGQDELSDPEMTTVTFKKGAKELSCIPELNDVQVKAWIQIGYRMYKGEIQEDVSVKRFYRLADGASGSEVLTGENIGERIAKDADFATEIKYEDGVTPDAVAAWKKAQQSGGAATPAPKAMTGGFPNKAKSGFPSPK